MDQINPSNRIKIPEIKRQLKLDVKTEIKEKKELMRKLARKDRGENK